MRPPLTRFPPTKENSLEHFHSSTGPTGMCIQSSRMSCKGSTWLWMCGRNSDQ